MSASRIPRTPVSTSTFRPSPRSTSSGARSSGSTPFTQVPGARARWGSGTRIRGSAGTGFRAPTFNDLFFPDFGNPDLQPERSMSWDAGVDQKLWQGRIRLGLTYFHNDFTNLITCCVSIPTAPFGGPVNA